MVTVIIPALNEAETVGSVIGLIKGSPLTSEIIVIDDKSSDNTLQVARDAGQQSIQVRFSEKGHH